MAFDYSGLQNTAKDLIAKFGRSVQIRSYIKAGDKFDPDLIPSDRPANAVLTNYHFHEIDGTLIKREDKKALISSTYPVSSDDKLVIDSVVFSILNVDLVAPGDSIIVYKAQVRK